MSECGPEDERLEAIYDRWVWCLVCDVCVSRGMGLRVPT